MRDYEVKKTLAKYLKKGDVIRGIITANCESLFMGIVDKVDKIGITYFRWGDISQSETISPEVIVFVELSDKEFEKKYEQKAKEVWLALQNSISPYETGYHERYNGWLSYDIYQLAKNCIEEEYTILGYCKVVGSSLSEKEIYLCAEDKNGNKFWCHADRLYIERMLATFEKRKRR